jgi:hypothetical protein
MSFSHWLNSRLKYFVFTHKIYFCLWHIQFRCTRSLYTRPQTPFQYTLHQYGLRFRIYVLPGALTKIIQKFFQTRCEAPKNVFDKEILHEKILQVLS